MKTSLTLVLCLFMISSAFAKKVKFAVDMGTHTISPLGIHVMGDFQVAAGYSLNYDPGSTLMSQAGASTIYTIIVNIPAFKTYEFKFVNGDQGYETEFVPEQCRIGYNFNDNRWIYVDSLQNDTTYLGAVKFGENAPAGKTFVRYMIDLQNAGPVSPDGVHFGSTFQGMNPLTHRMYSFIPNVYEGYGYINNGVEQFRFYNGNTVGSAETVPAPCATGGNRSANVTKDTILPTYCFNSCATCTPATLKEQTVEHAALSILPNPAGEFAVIGNLGGADKIAVVDISGKLALVISPANADKQVLDLSGLQKGVYTVYVKNGSAYRHTRLIVQ